MRDLHVVGRTVFVAAGALAIARLLGCGGDDANDALDAGARDAGRDGTVDAAGDGSVDATADAGSDVAEGDTSIGDSSVDAPDDASCGVTCTAVPPSTAQCIAGRCLVTLVTGEDSQGDYLYDIAVDATYVYFAVAGEPAGWIKRVPIVGGPVVVLAEANGGANGVAVNGTTLFFTMSLLGLVASIPIDGGAITYLADEYADMARPTELALDGANLFWSVPNYAQHPVDDGIWKLPLVDGGVPVMIAPDYGVGYGQIAVDPNFLYSSGWVDGGAVVGVPLDGGIAAPLTWAPAGSYVNSVAVDSTSVYYTWGNDINDIDGGIGGVTSVPLDGGPSAPLAAGPSFYGLAVDATHVYWTQAGGGVGSAPLDGGAATILASDVAGYIAVDATSVYWTTATSPGAIMKLTPK